MVESSSVKRQKLDAAEVMVEVFERKSAPAEWGVGLVGAGSKRQHFSNQEDAGGRLLRLACFDTQRTRVRTTVAECLKFSLLRVFVLAPKKIQMPSFSCGKMCGAIATALSPA